MPQLTPTCKSCGTKFPGKDTCKTCGLDPNAPRTKEWKIKKVALLPTATVEDRRSKKAKIRSITNAPAKRKHGRNV